MDGSARQGGRARHGGILGLAEALRDHGPAIEYDLMTMTAFTLGDLGRALPARALLSFVGMVPRTSRTFASMRPDEAEDAAWEGNALLAQLLAALVDEVRDLAWSFAQSRTRRSLRSMRPRPIPRPGVRDARRRWGRGAIPVGDFERWWKEE
ncbi:hypothetical protein HLV35_03115 [Eggerthellaceae bacterium zg-997]|nr:hypothetical protein [Eggerthellaceae bacterium zg-997]